MHKKYNRKLAFLSWLHDIILLPSPANFVIYIQVQDFHGKKRPKFPPFFSTVHTSKNSITGFTFIMGNNVKRCWCIRRLWSWPMFKDMGVMVGRILFVSSHILESQYSSCQTTPNNQTKSFGSSQSCYYPALPLLLLLLLLPYLFNQCWFVGQLS